MDIAIILLILSSNPIILDFKSKLDVDNLTQFITNEEIVAYSETQILNLKHSFIEVEGNTIEGSLLLSSSENKKRHLIFFKSGNPDLWGYIEENVTSNSKFTQKMKGTGNLSRKGSTFYSMPEFIEKEITYKIDIVHVKGKTPTESETQIFIKMSTDI